MVGAVVVSLLFFPSVGYPQVPKAEDIAACNLEAQHAIGKGAGARDAALPNTKDQSRAAEARRADPTTQGVSRGTQSDDPQQQGMDTEGAKDPAYQAVYRTCMRRAGF